MSSSLVSNIMEVIEPESQLYNQLIQRVLDIPKYEYFGPPDICYLVKEMKGGLLSSPTRVGMFHFVYGVDSSSSASVAAYIKSVIAMHESNSKVKVIKATFCMFDIVKKRDIRVEISIPGGSQVYAMDETQTKQNITGVDWNYVFMSSLLRSFEPQPVPGMRIVKELESQELYNDFLLVASSLFRQDARFGELLDTAKQGSNLMIQKISEYLIKKKKIQDLINFLLPCKNLLIDSALIVQKEDPMIASYLSDALMSVDKNKETIMMLAEKIEAYPYLVPLLLKQAQAFVKSEYYEYAMKLSKICVDLCPESFETWFQLAEVYYYMKNIKTSLIAIDIGPQYQDVEYVSKVQLVADYDISRPKVRKNTDSHPYLMLEPSKVDFRKPNEDTSQLMLMAQKGDDYVPNYSDMSREELEQVKKLMRVNNIQLSQCERRCYELLVKMEKEISWEVLLKIKSATFLSEQDNQQWVNPFFNAESSKTFSSSKYAQKMNRKKEEEKGSSGGGVDDSIIEISNQAERFVAMRGKAKLSSKIDTIAEEGGSDAEDKEEENQPSQKKKNRNETLKMATEHQQEQVTFEGGGSGQEDNEEQEKSDTDIILEQAEEQDNRKKRQCYKIDKLFALLFEDLNLLCEWENDEKKRVPSDKSQGGVLWIQRGILAERLNRKRLAERAYRNGIEKGFSLYAWSRLLKIYADTYNPKACLVCMAEIFDQADEDGIKVYNKIPAWIEDTLHGLIASNGLKSIIRLVKEMELEDCQALTSAIQRAHTLKVEGFDQ